MLFREDAVNLETNVVFRRHAIIQERPDEELEQQRAVAEIGKLHHRRRLGQHARMLLRNLIQQLFDKLGVRFITHADLNRAPHADIFKRPVRQLAAENVGVRDDNRRIIERANHGGTDVDRLDFAPDAIDFQNVADFNRAFE